MRRIETADDVETGLAELLAADPRLLTIAEIAGPLPLRRRPGGFEGLAAIITAQQISTSAAASIWARLNAAVDPFTPEACIAMPEEALRKTGLSRPKVRALRSAASACADGLDLNALAELPAEAAIAQLTAVKGVGSWTAEIYLLFCIGHADIFPAGDLALQIAAQHALALNQRPTEKVLRAIASDWSPWRAVAARLFWAYYRVQRSTASPHASPGPPL